MTWHKVLLTKKQIEEEQVLMQMERQFEQSYIAAEGPSDMALFSDDEYQDDTIHIYFSPGCSPSCDELITQHGGEECDPPKVEHTFLVTGNDDAEDLLE